jgi:mitogen-activated protein kinase kinase kinase
MGSLATLRRLSHAWQPFVYAPVEFIYVVVEAMLARGYTKECPDHRPSVLLVIAARVNWRPTFWANQMPNRKGPPPASSSLYVAQNRRTQRQNGVAAAIRGRANEVDEGGDRYYSGLDAGYASDGTEGDADVDDEDAMDADGVDEDEEADAEGRVSSIQRIYSGSMRVPALPRPPEKSYDLILPSDKSSNASSRTSTGSGSEDDENASDSASVSSVDSDKLDAERYAWQNMLSNVLEGDVLKSEKTRLSSSLLHQLDDSAGQRKYQASQIWWGVRAALRQRSVEAEQRFVTEARSRIPKIFEELLSFTIPHIEDKVAWHAEAAHQVQGFLGHFSWALSLYPTSRSLQLSQSVFQEPGLQDRIDALQAWSTITSRLHVHLGILQKWTGSDALEITKPGLEKIDEETDTPGVEEREAPLTNGALAHHKHTKPKILDTSSFVERMMKEESIETLFKKRTIVDIYPLVRAAKETFLVNRKEFSGLGLPPFSDDLYALVSFPMLLVQEALILRLETAARVNKDDPSIILIDQLTEDFRDGLKRATQIKREYLEILEADPENVWQVPAIDLDAFNKVLVDALKLFFRLLHWKLKSGSKAIYLKETEVVENEWDFLSKATEQIDGGDMHIAEHFSYAPCACRGLSLIDGQDADASAHPARGQLL